MFCPNCQKEIADGSKFCYSCGAAQPGYVGGPAPSIAAQKRLTKSVRDKKIAGVCGGLAEYFDIDPTIVRVLWVIAVFFGGTGLLLYIILALVLPVGSPAPMVTVPVTTTSPNTPI